VLDALFRDPGRERFLDYGEELLNTLIHKGVAVLPQAGLEFYNSLEVEYLRLSPVEETEKVPF